MPKHLSDRSALLRLLSYGFISMRNGEICDIDEVALAVLDTSEEEAMGHGLRELGFDTGAVEALESEISRVGSVVDAVLPTDRSGEVRQIRVTALSHADGHWALAVRRGDQGAVTATGQARETVEQLRTLAPIMEECGLGIGVFDAQRKILFESPSWNTVRTRQIQVERDASGLGNRRPESAVQKTVRTDDGGVYDIVEEEFRNDYHIGLAWDATELWEAYETIRTQAQEMARLNEEIRDLAMRDGLTGAYNRRYLEERVGVEVDRAQRYSEELSVIFFDVDDFKPYNDAYGHVAGDYVLRSITDLVSARLRRTDVLARYGGEEFAILLPGTPLRRAVVVAETLRKQIAMHDWKHRDVTISLGVSGVAPEDEALTFIDRVDRAMYRAKRSGRNQLVVVDPRAEDDSDAAPETESPASPLGD